MSNEPLLSVEGLRVADARTGRPIVCGVDLAVRAGETLAIVGESGSGKSMTARTLVGLLPPGMRAEGSVRSAGVDVLSAPPRALRKLRAEHVSLLFQDPFGMLDPMRRVGDFLADCLDTLPAGSSREQEIARRLREVGIDDPQVAVRHPFELSGGLRQRVAIAAALARDPAVLIADEPTTALDVTNQRVVLDLLDALRRSRGMSLVLITHDLRVAFELSDRVAVMYCGRIVEVGPAEILRTRPRHPYTHGLLRSEPPLNRRVAELASIPGVVSRPDEVEGRCCFAPRCAHRQPACEAGQPALDDGGRGTSVACVRSAELRLEIADDLPLGAPVPAEPSPTVLEVSALSKSFRTGRGEVTAVKDVTLSVGAGKCVAVVGESGSGKTTVARCVVGLERPTAGSISLAGAAARDVKVQMVLQDPYGSLNPSWTIGASIREAFQCRAERVDDWRAEVGRALELVGLDPSFAARKPIALSGGQRQRVAIARALAAEPELLICDEPVSALDVSVQAQILNLLNRLRRELGTSVLLITHDLGVARQLADHVYVMHRGVVVEHGPPDVLLDDPRHPYTQRLIASTPRVDGDAHHHAEKELT